MKWTQLAFGLASHVPGVYKRLSRGEPDSLSARYCYSVWLRHLVKAWQSGLNTAPRRVVELGPGGSLGASLAALLCGADTAIAVDVLPHADMRASARILDELALFFSRNEPIPHDKSCASIRPTLEDYSFPARLLDKERLEPTLATTRIERIRSGLAGESRSPIHYVLRPRIPSLPNGGMVDMIFSQAVMEYVADIDQASREMFAALRPGGFVSHQIDLRSHNLHQLWNGHWSYSDITWRLIRGGRPYSLNREPCSRHIQALTGAGFEIVRVERQQAPAEPGRSRFAKRFNEMSEEDAATSGVFVQARKPA